MKRSEQVDKTVSQTAGKGSYFCTAGRADHVNWPLYWHRICNKRRYEFAGRLYYGNDGQKSECKNRPLRQRQVRTFDMKRLSSGAVCIVSRFRLLFSYTPESQWHVWETGGIQQFHRLQKPLCLLQKHYSNYWKTSSHRVMYGSGELRAPKDIRGVLGTKKPESCWRVHKISTVQSVWRAYENKQIFHHAKYVSTAIQAGLDLAPSGKFEEPRSVGSYVCSNALLTLLKLMIARFTVVLTTISLVGFSPRTSTPATVLV